MVSRVSHCVTLVAKLCPIAFHNIRFSAGLPEETQRELNFERTLRSLTTSASSASGSQPSEFAYHPMGSVTIYSPP